MPALNMFSSMKREVHSKTKIKYLLSMVSKLSTSKLPEKLKNSFTFLFFIYYFSYYAQRFLSN